ncbi:MAG TPA: mycofactocin biosynthesis peptidyl-dipeptidase MftE [Mycobacteriales bacterium]|nr:mycofactocin biosynthesis peptidyl-dipeptidase MftE [Mycobacteriales bacterium]
MKLAELTWTGVAAVPPALILAVPLGSTEQHGPHLPLSTDTRIAVALCERLANARAEVMVAPAVAYGASGEHAGFAGTLSIGAEVLERLVVELGRSATDTFAHVVFVSAHGGNAAAVTAAARLLRAEGRDVLVHAPRWRDDLHAGYAETSLMLALEPSLVRQEDAVIGDTRSWAELEPLLRGGGVRSVSANGVLGDPTGASAAAGFELLDRLGVDLVAAVGSWRPSVVAATR